MSYKSTLNLPQTDFPMQANLRQLEPKILELWGKHDLYKLVRKKAKGRRKFILHDGPPYANGDIHLGHALNKILKDFVVKYKIMRGFDLPFVPGWDCHGLPVEHQLFRELGLTKHQIDKIEFRKKAKQFALKFVQIQKQQFKRLGLLADWQKPYLTLDFAYEAQILRALGRLAKKKYIYHGLKPINWCSNCETALAEAEIEYQERRSPSIYVKFKLLREPNTSFIIWTTTPWTLLANVAVAVHPKLKYCFLEVKPAGPQEKQIWILAEDLAEQVMHQLQIPDYRKIKTVKGADLENLQAQHPFIQRNSLIVLADYVSNQEGTGCVHTAPGHGQEDYLTGLKYKLPVLMPVDEKGKFDQSCPEFQGLTVFAANQAVIDKMQQNKSLLFNSDTLHSYPHCWRCKNPLITRSTKQWFMNVEHNNLRTKALKEINKVQWVPEAGKLRIASMIKTRPDWCLSRQRFWGVPIPALHCRNCSYAILDAQVIEHLARMVSREGADAWFTRSMDELIPKKLRCPVCRGEQFSKEEDIVDVWFDSGVSHQAVLAKNKELEFPAALYLEGSDQHRGWFQTALLTAIPLAGKAPYQQVLTHGFVVDGEGKKMSKSRGNVISPQEITSQSGAEMLRLWVASCDYSDDVRISAEILTGIADAYRKIRNTLRFMLGNLHDFQPKYKLSYSQLLEIDKWALSALAKLLTEVTEDYERYLYYKVYRRIYNFCVNQMSAFYLDILKDRLYTFGQRSLARRSAQTAICAILTSLVKIITPILNFTAEEVWLKLCAILEIKDTPLVILNRWPKIEGKWINSAVEQKISRLAKMRNLALKAIEQQREKGLIHSSLEARVKLYTTDGKLARFLSQNQELLTTMFIVSEVTVEKVASLPVQVSTSSDLANLGLKVEKINFSKCQRCWNFRSSVGQNKQYPLLCQRCIQVLEGRK